LWEWCSVWYDAKEFQRYASETAVDPQGASTGTYPVLGLLRRVLPVGALRRGRAGVPGLLPGLPRRPSSIKQVEGRGPDLQAEPGAEARRGVPEAALEDPLRTTERAVWQASQAQGAKPRGDWYQYQTSRGPLDSWRNSGGSYSRSEVFRYRVQSSLRWQSFGRVLVLVHEKEYGRYASETAVDPAGSNSK